MVGISRVLQFLLLASAALAAVSYASAAVVGTSSIYAPAVILENNTGTITSISLTISTGNGTVSVVGPSDVGQSTLASAKTAAYAASSYLGRNESAYDFKYTISGAVNVSGPSGGTAFALLAVSALSGRHLLGNFTVTGTISPDGSVGQIGGIYDKVGAAHAKGLAFALVPEVQNSSFEAELYQIAQDSFSMPLVQVQNLSEAAAYAFASKPVQASSGIFQYYTIFDLSVPNASLSCSNGCDMPLFDMLPSFTFSMASNEISALSAYPGFASSQEQMGAALSQARAVGSKGYGYFGANLAFIDYINAFVFAHHGASLNDAVALIHSATQYCSSIFPPNMTSANYEYVLGGELRQSWAAITLSQALAASNSSQADSDTISSMMSSIAESTAWCNFAGQMYSTASSMGGNTVEPVGLEGIANASMARAAVYGDSLYMQAAGKAYSEGNYALALLSSEYAYALAQQGNESASQLSESAVAIADNSTFGTWATQFANEALFYTYQSKAESNASMRDLYASQAYSTAILARQVGSAFSSINSSLAFAGSQAVAISPGELVDIRAAWIGGSAPYTVYWRVGNSTSCSSDTHVFQTDRNVTANNDSATVMPSSTSHYCALVADSSGKVLPVSLSAQTRALPGYNQSITVSVSNVTAEEQQRLMDTISYVQGIAVVLTAVLAIAVVLAIQLYRLKDTTRKSRRRKAARGGRR